MNAPGILRAPAMEPRLRFRTAARTHLGHVRSINEDRIFDGTEVGCWAIADGMGGHGGGDFAAQTVVDELKASVTQPDPNKLGQALRRANHTIVAANIGSGNRAGATVVAASACANCLHVAWAGDSRAYLIAGGTLRQLTHDHTLVQEMVDAGLLTAQAALHHPQANVVTRALGVSPEVELDHIAVELETGFRILLCSDGLSRSLRPSDIDPMLAIDVLAASLVQLALERDGSDNISLMLIEICTARADEFEKRG